MTFNSFYCVLQLQVNAVEMEQPKRRLDVFLTIDQLFKGTRDIMAIASTSMNSVQTIIAVTMDRILEKCTMVNTHYMVPINMINL